MAHTPEEQQIEENVLSVLAQGGAQTQWGLALALGYARDTMGPMLIALRSLISRGVVRSIVDIHDIGLDIHGVYRLAQPGEQLAPATFHVPR